MSTQGKYFAEERDMNPNSPTYGQTRWVRVPEKDGMCTIAPPEPKPKPQPDPVYQFTWSTVDGSKYVVTSLKDGTTIGYTISIPVSLPLVKVNRTSSGVEFIVSPNSEHKSFGGTVVLKQNESGKTLTKTFNIPAADDIITFNATTTRSTIYAGEKIEIDVTSTVNGQFREYEINGNKYNTRHCELGPFDKVGTNSVVVTQVGTGRSVTVTFTVAAKHEPVYVFGAVRDKSQPAYTYDITSTVDDVNCDWSFEKSTSYIDVKKVNNKLIIRAESESITTPASFSWGITLIQSGSGKTIELKGEHPELKPEPRPDRYTFTSKEIEAGKKWSISSYVMSSGTKSSVTYSCPSEVLGGLVKLKVSSDQTEITAEYGENPDPKSKPWTATLKQAESGKEVTISGDVPAGNLYIFEFNTKSGDAKKGTYKKLDKQNNIATVELGLLDSLKIFRVPGTTGEMSKNPVGFEFEVTGPGAPAVTKTYKKPSGLTSRWGRISRARMKLDLNNPVCRKPITVKLIQHESGKVLYSLENWIYPEPKERVIYYKDEVFDHNVMSFWSDDTDLRVEIKVEVYEDFEIAHGQGGTVMPPVFLTSDKFGPFKFVGQTNSNPLVVNLQIDTYHDDEGPYGEVIRYNLKSAHGYPSCDDPSITFIEAK